MKKTYICGYYGMQNSGDDALLCATLSGAREFLGANNFEVHSPQKVIVPKAGAYEAKINSKPRYRGENRLLQCYNALRSNQIIFGGGSVLHCKRDMDTKYLMMKLAGRGPHLALGVGVESFASVAAEKSCRRFLNHCSYVGLRDKASYDVARSIAPNANLELTFDLAPSLLPLISEQYNNARSLYRNDRIKSSLVSLDEENSEMVAEPCSRRGVGVLLCPRESIGPNSTESEIETEKQRLRDLALALTEIYRETKEPIFIFDMNGHQSLGDHSVHDELQSYLPKNVPIFRYGYQSNPLRLIRQLSRLKFSVAMRLHGSIFSYLAGTPVLSVNYHDKCVGWCDQIGMPEEYRYDASNIDLSRMIAEGIRGAKQGFKSCHMTLEQAYQASIRNFTSPLSQYS